MKKKNSIITVTIIATFVFSIVAFQPTVTEANNNVSPTATPSPRKIRKIDPRRKRKPANVIDFPDLLEVQRRKSVKKGKSVPKSGNLKSKIKDRKNS